jgi:hypothetical protein
MLTLLQRCLTTLHLNFLVECFAFELGGLLRVSHLVASSVFVDLDFLHRLQLGLPQLVGHVVGVFRSLHSHLLLRTTMVLLFYLGSFLLYDFHSEFLIVFLLQVSDALRLLASLSDLLHGTLLFLQQHAHSVLQLLYVFLNLEADCPRLVVRQIFALYVNYHVLQPVRLRHRVAAPVPVLLPLGRVASGMGVTCIRAGWSARVVTSAPVNCSIIKH